MAAEAGPATGVGLAFKRECNEPAVATLRSADARPPDVNAPPTNSIMGTVSPRHIAQKAVRKEAFIIPWDPNQKARPLGRSEMISLSVSVREETELPSFPEQPETSPYSSQSPPSSEQNAARQGPSLLPAFPCRAAKTSTEHLSPFTVARKSIAGTVIPDRKRRCSNHKPDSAISNAIVPRVDRIPGCLCRLCRDFLQLLTIRVRTIET
jgi:hypothetical protein